MPHPTHWILDWFNPQTGQREQSAPILQRAKARGDAIILKALGMLDVQVIAKGI